MCKDFAVFFAYGVCYVKILRFSLHKQLAIYPIRFLMNTLASLAVTFAGPRTWAICSQVPINNC